MLSTAVAKSALSRGSSNRKSGWSTWTAQSTTDQAWHVVSRFTGLQQHACFVAGPLALKHGRGERAAASPDQSQIWMADFDCAISYQSTLTCSVKICGPAAACRLCSWFACFQARTQRAPSRGSSNCKSGWTTWTAPSPTDQAWHVLSRFAGPQQLACFVAGSLAFKRGRGERAIARLEQSQIWMVNLDCAINYRSSLACCVKIYGPAAACVLCSWSACPQARPRRARRRESRPITNLDGQFRLRERLPIKLGLFCQDLRARSSRRAL